MGGPISNKNVPTSAPPPDVGGKAGPENVGSVQQSNVTQPAGGAPTPQPSSDSAQQTKGAKGYAQSKAADALLSTQARGLAPPPTKDQQIRTIAAQAKALGLPEKEIKNLTDRLNKLNDQDFKKECKFLNTQILGVDGNSDRAIRTYNELKNLQDVNPHRLTDDHIHMLSRGVAEARDKWGKGSEGVLGQDGAFRAANALINMPKPDYDALNKTLNQAGKGADGKPVPGSSRGMEQALILKAAGIRNNEFINRSAKDKLENLQGKPSSVMATVQQYAQDIRGTQRAVLAQQSTAIDPFAGNAALQQRWNDSCGPTTVQGMRAELDPVYARKLHQEFIHGTVETGDIATEQKSQMTGHGGIAVSRGASGGAGTKLNEVLNTVCRGYTGVRYTAIPAGNSVKERNATLNTVADKLKRGIDVPIRAGWPGGGGHFMLLTDVRGKGKDQLFLLTDPFKGQTVWITREQLASGKTPFPAGNGALTHIY
jgi:hypothetical protein